MSPSNLLSLFVVIVLRISYFLGSKQTSILVFVCLFLFLGSWQNCWNGRIEWPSKICDIGEISCKILTCTLLKSLFYLTSPFNLLYMDLFVCGSYIYPMIQEHSGEYCYLSLYGEFLLLHLRWMGEQLLNCLPTPYSQYLALKFTIFVNICHFEFLKGPFATSFEFSPNFFWKLDHICPNRHLRCGSFAISFDVLPWL